MDSRKLMAAFLIIGVVVFVVALIMGFRYGYFRLHGRLGDVCAVIGALLLLAASCLRSAVVLGADVDMTKWRAATVAADFTGTWLIALALLLLAL